MIYFDNSATSYPKCRAALKRQYEFYSCCGNGGRSGHRYSRAASNAVYEAREKLAFMFGCKSENAVFCHTATLGLNMAIKGIASSRRVAVCSDMEHNAVMRPLKKLESEGKIRIETVKTDRWSDKRTIDALAGALSRNSGEAFVVFTQASNINGQIMPVEQLAQTAKKHGAPFITDASQSGGYIETDIDGAGIDALVISTHKGIGAPFGSSALLLGNECPSLSTVVEGGTGSLSLEYGMPEFPPDRFEAGTLNAPAIAGLSVALDALNGEEHDIYAAYECSSLISCELKNMKNVRVHGECALALPVVLFSVDGADSELVAEKLAERDIAVRGGYHCAPSAHAALKTPGGAVRVSPGCTDTPAMAREFIDALAATVRDLSTS